MSDERRKYLGGVKHVVVKLGTQLLTDARGRLDAGFLTGIAAQVAEIKKRGVGVTIVSSGAIGAGVAELGLKARPKDLAQLQATAAVGQRRLMDNWADAFSPLGMTVAQILLTREDIEHRGRFLNLRNTIHAIGELGAIAIVNENDTVSTDEIIKITFGDNDILAAAVAHALRAELLVLLSVVDGIHDATGKPVRLIENPASARPMVRTEKSPLGKGGMDSKIEAARMVTDAGEALVVADGRAENVLRRILEGEEMGTLFVPAGRKRSARSRWIGTVRSSGAIVVDAGCAAALVEKNRSLLAAGVTGVQGEFAPGDVVEIVGADGRRLARGLTNYGSGDVGKVCGEKTSEVRALLGDAAYDEVVHRDNLVIDRG